MILALLILAHLVAFHLLLASVVVQSHYLRWAGLSFGERLSLGLRWWRYVRFLIVANEIDGRTASAEEFWSEMHKAAVAATVRRFL